MMQGSFLTHNCTLSGVVGDVNPPDVKEEIFGQEIHPVILTDPVYPHVKLAT